MSKKSNRGKGYFYAMGQRDLINGLTLTGDALRRARRKLKSHAFQSWLDGCHGF